MHKRKNLGGGEKETENTQGKKGNTFSATLEQIYEMSATLLGNANPLQKFS